MKELKLTGTLRSERILPDTNYRKAYQQLRAALVAQCGQPYPQVEIVIRYSDPRQEWIDEWYNKAKKAEAAGRIFLKFCKDTTVAVVCGSSMSRAIACAAPRHGDKYDQHTGIAVVYAKLACEPIPDYI